MEINLDNSMTAGIPQLHRNIWEESEDSERTKDIGGLVLMY